MPAVFRRRHIGQYGAALGSAGAAAKIGIRTTNNGTKPEDTTVELNGRNKIEHRKFFKSLGNNHLLSNSLAVAKKYRQIFGLFRPVSLKITSAGFL